MDLEFIENKKYMDRAGKIYIFKGRFNLDVAPLLFEDDRGLPTWRYERGGYSQRTLTEKDISLEVKEPRYVYLNVYNGDICATSTYNFTISEQYTNSGKAPHYLHTLKIDVNSGTCTIFKHGESCLGM